RKSASQVSFICFNCFRCVLPKDALLPSFSLESPFGICCSFPLRRLLRCHAFCHELGIVAHVDADHTAQHVAVENCPSNADQRHTICAVASVPGELNYTLSISHLCAVVVHEATDISEIE